MIGENPITYPGVDQRSLDHDQRRILLAALEFVAHEVEAAPLLVAGRVHHVQRGRRHQHPQRLRQILRVDRLAGEHHAHEFRRPVEPEVANLHRREVPEFGGIARRLRVRTKEDVNFLIRIIEPINGVRLQYLPPVSYLSLIHI